MIVGVAYYPEHWNRSLWIADADLMQKTGVQLVRMAEFAWSRLEPKDGVFDFSWLDEAISIFEKHGIKVVLCTPTSCPPLWLYEKHPDSVMVEKDGKPTPLGVRGHRCINHPDMLFYVQRIVERMTAHYADCPAVVAWQIDNELEAYSCYCQHCSAKFRQWVQNKYETLEKVNQSYGNAVWSGEYSSWNQIQPPHGHYPDAWMNPAYMLDYCRFASDNMIDFVRMQTEIIRRHCPGIPVTTNVWFSGHMPDFYQEFRDLNFVAYDNYPPTRLPEDQETCYSHAFHLDLMRGVKNKPFWIMEQLSGGMGCWAPMARTPEPGMIKGYALQAFAHGADTVVHFRWRTATTGAEMHWHGLLDHSNVPGRRFREFADLCQTASELSDLRGTDIRSDVAILMAFENEYAFKLQPQTSGYYYFEQMQRLHAAFGNCGLNVDIISQHNVLDGYRIVIAPEMYVTDEAVSQRLHDYARRGGIVILTTRSGVKDVHNNAVMAPLPGVYADMAGIHVTEYNPISSDHVPVCFDDQISFDAKQWCDVLETDTAETMAVYGGEYFKGTPAVTCNHYGSGQVYYIATVGSQALYDHLIHQILAQNEIPFIPNLPARVEITKRSGCGTSAYFVFNNDDKEKDFVLFGEPCHLNDFEMKIIKEAAPSSSKASSPL